MGFGTVIIIPQRNGYACFGIIERYWIPSSETRNTGTLRIRTKVSRHDRIAWRLPATNKHAVMQPKPAYVKDGHLCMHLRIQGSRPCPSCMQIKVRRPGHALQPQWIASPGLIRTYVSLDQARSTPPPPVDDVHPRGFKLCSCVQGRSLLVCDGEFAYPCHHWTSRETRGARESRRALELTELSSFCLTAGRRPIDIMDMTRSQ